MTTPIIPFPKDGLWTVRQACEWLSMTELSLRTMLKRRQIPPEIILKLGRRVRFLQPVSNQDTCRHSHDGRQVGPVCE